MSQTIGIPQALAVLTPGAKWALTGTEYSELVWLDTVQSQPSENAVQDTITILTLQEPFDACKAEAKRLLSLSDWSVLPDVNISNKAEFEAYRAELRVLVLTPVQSPVFPTEPQPVWI